MQCPGWDTMVGMPGRGSSTKGAAKREEILRAALELFAVEGYRGTSLRTLAQRCNISLAGLMHYFDSREDLLVKTLQLRDEVARANTEGLPPMRGFIAVLRANANEPGLIELFVTLLAAASDPEHPAAAFMAERFDRLITGLSELIRTHPDGRELSPAQVRSHARRLIAVADGLQQQWVVDRGIDIAEEFLAYTAAQPLAGLKP